MRLPRSGLAALALLAILATAPSARAQCFWDGGAWVCWTHPLFPEVSLVPNVNPYWGWAQNWGGPNWRFYGWLPM